jgi:predicted RNA-binding Zn-ribbon protein involved in translation (DUF1610 family)
VSEERGRGAEILREYLATRDVPCEGCGYNLRGALDVFCPECGRVIPRPPSEDVRRMAADPATLRLYCTRCGHPVTGVNAPRCPECGAAEMERFVGERPPAVRYRKWLPQDVPLLIAINGVLGLCLLLPALGFLLVEAMRPGTVTGRTPLVTGAGLAALPAAAFAAWWRWRGALMKLQPGERRAIAFLVVLGGFPCLLAAGVMIR